MMHVYNIHEYTLHCHEDAIEIIFVLKGTVKVKASFEYFTLSEGDYVVVNREDSHKIWRQDKNDNMVAVFHISLDYYHTYFPYLYYVLFACESFDLARHKGQTAHLRQLLLKLMDSILQGEEKSRETTADITTSLMQLLVEEYSLEKYYNRNEEINPIKLETYYTIVQYINEKYQNKTILQDISRNEFYSKSYISHLFKEVSGAGFQDILGYIRVFKAERLLLETDCSITMISSQCGFSDAKYFNGTFQKWFQMKPADYRKLYQKQIGKEKKITKVEPDMVEERIQQLKNLAQDNTEYKVAMTPITLKNIGTKIDLLNYLKQAKTLKPLSKETNRDMAGTTYALIKITDNGNAEHTRELLEKLLQDLQIKVDGDIEYSFIK
jgi:AraC-like DNA-binding protein